MSDKTIRIIVKSVFLILLVFLNAWVVQYCFNILPFEMKLDYGQAICLNILCSVLFKNAGFKLKDKDE